MAGIVMRAAPSDGGNGTINIIMPQDESAVVEFLVRNSKLTALK